MTHNVWENSLILISRVALSLIYLWAGYRKVFNWNQTKKYMRSRQIIGISILLPIAVTMQIAGSLSLCLGFYARLGAAALVLFTLPSTILMHGFWNFSGEKENGEKIHFLKDIAIVGGLLLFILLGAGRYAIN